jgi:YVTN family beta-propeller protein
MYYLNHSGSYPSQNKIYSLDVDTSVLNETVVGENPLGMSINTDNNTLYVCNNVSNSISIIECDFDSVINTISGIDGPTDVIFNQNENKIYVSQEFSQQVSIINCESLVKLCTSTFYYNVSKI